MFVAIGAWSGKDDGISLTFDLFAKSIAQWPRPRPALVIRYSYLWTVEHLRGKEEGMKDRPCVVVLLHKDERGSNLVTVLPITHQAPASSEEALAIEISDELKQRLGLDDSRSWIMLTEANRFTWPGSDLCRENGGDPSSAAYGLLPDALFEQVRLGFLAAKKSRSTRVVRRT